MIMVLVSAIKAFMFSKCSHFDFNEEYEETSSPVMLLPMRLTLTRVLRVGADLKSTLHL